MLALLCGGQGVLGAETFALTAERPEAASVFATATELLGQDPRELVGGGDDEAISANRISQILTATATLATHACLRDALDERVAVTGYSVGEMAAWSIAGVWPAETALHLTDARARAMDAADGTGGRLGYVRGLPRAAVAQLAADYGCAIAIRNPGNLFVVGGWEADVAALCEAARTHAARAGLLAVRIASHTPMLAAAVAPIQAALDARTSAGPAPDRLLLAGGGGRRILDAPATTAELAGQVAVTVDWAGALEALGENGVDRILDLGPGHALADMAREALPGARAYAADQFRSIEGLRDWLARA